MNLRFFSAFTLLFLLSQTSFAQGPNWQWAKSAGGIDYSGGYSIATDANGNSFVTGSFNSPTITFDTITLTNNSVLSDIFIAKYDATGNIIWAKSAGGINEDMGLGIDTDINGNVYVTGYFWADSITFDSITLTHPRFFIAKYDSSGNVLWAKDAVSGIGVSYGIKVDSNGNVFITGAYGTIAFDSSTAFTSVGATDVFLAKYDASGNFLWAKSAGGTDYETGSGIAVDANGNSYLTGYFWSTSIAFGSTILINDTSTFSDVFIAKYDPSGNLLWAKSAGGTSRDEGRSITVDDHENSYITGYFGGSINFGNTTLTNDTSIFTDIFIAKYDSVGNLLWAKSAGGADTDISNSISVDANENSYVTGIFQSPYLTFGNTTLVNMNNLSFDVFLVKYDVAGNVVWAKSIGNIGDDEGHSISANASGHLFLTGYYRSPYINWGIDTLTNMGISNIFIAKLDATTGIIESFNPSTQISITPNPTTSQISITNSKIIDEIIITNLLSQIIYHAKPHVKKVSLKIKDEGIYFVSIITGNQVATGKLVVSR